MLYSDYNKRMNRLARVLAKLRKFRIPIIIFLVLAVGTVAALLGTRGIITDSGNCPSELEYGEEFNYSASAFLGDVTYQFRAEGSSQWTSEVPKYAGNYYVRAVADRTFGGQSYGPVHSFTIKPKRIDISIAGSTLFGEDPAVSADLEKGDSIAALRYEYEDLSAKITFVTIYREDIVITNANGEDISFSYQLPESVTGRVSFAPREVTVTVAENVEFEYDGCEHGSNIVEVEDGELAPGDSVDVQFNDTIIDCGQIQNSPDVSIVHGEGEDSIDVSQNYIITIVPGTITVLPRKLNITTHGDEKVYDGSELVCTGYDIDEETPLVEGESLSVASFAVRKNVGSCDNELVFQILNASGEDVSDNYDITLTCGTLKVTERALTIQTATATHVYSGDAFADTGYTITSGSLAPGEELTVVSSSAIKDVGGAQNEFVVRIACGDDETTSNYAVEWQLGTLEVTPKPVYITAGSAEWTYDGKAHSCREFEADGIQKSHLSVNSATEVTFVKREGGEVVSTVNMLTFDIVDEKPQNFELFVAPGELKINVCSITITTDTAFHVYDGASFSKPTYTAEGMPEGHRFAVESSASITDFGYVQNVFTGYIERIADSLDVSDNCTVAWDIGTLYVDLRPLTVTAGDCTKEYDGTPLTNTDPDNYTIEVGEDIGLAPGHTASVTFGGSVTDADTAPNIITSVTVYAGGADVTANYAISVVDGMLTVTPRKVTVRTNNLKVTYADADYSESGYTVVSGSFLAGHGLTATSVTTVHDVTEEGGVENVVEYVVYGTLAYNYEVTVTYGRLVVDPIELTVTTRSYNEYYDALTHTPGYDITSGAVLSTHTHYAFSDTSINEVLYQDDMLGIINVVAVRIVRTSDWSDQTHNYKITYVNGRLVVRPRPLHFTSPTSSFEYDGQWHYGSAMSEDGGYGTVGDQVIVYSPAARVIDVADGLVTNAFTYVIARMVGGGYELDEHGDIVDYSANYQIDADWGDIYVTARSITVRTATAEFVYDGAEHDCTDWSVVSADSFVQNARLLEAGSALALPSLTVTASTKVKRVMRDGGGNIVGKDNVLTFDFAGDARDKQNYSLEYEWGTLTVTPAPLTVSTPDMEKEYDGLPLGDGYCEAHGLAEGDSLVIDSYAQITEVADSGAQNVVHVQKIVDLNNNDVTDCYDTIAFDFGTLTLLKRQLHILTGSERWEYDGVPHSLPEYDYVSGYPANGQTLEIVSYASIVNVGTTPNEIVFVVKQGDIEKTQNYELTIDLGELEIVEKENSEDWDHGDPEDFPPEDDDGNPIEPYPVLTIESQSSNYVYLRYLSYGDYAGTTSWRFALPYTGDNIRNGVDTYSVNNLTSIALEGKVGYVNLTIEHIEYPSAVVPYYVSYLNYDAYDSDLGYSGNKTRYSTMFMPYSYVSDNGAKLTPHTDPAIVAVERAYREYVYNTYLTMPDATRAFMNGIISEQGFDRSAVDIIAAVAEYMKAAGTYDPEYDTAVDTSGDVAVAFLRDYKSGVCRHFATSAVMLYRALGIPARYTVGVVGQTEPGQVVALNNLQVHAWVEVYIDGIGWVYVEVTGGYGGDQGGGGDEKPEDPDPDDPDFNPHLLIQTGPGDWTYDGKAHSMPTYQLLQGNLYPGHSIQIVEPVPTVTNVLYNNIGEVIGTPNAFTVRIVDEGGTDRTGMYSIDYDYGMLTVSPKPVIVVSCSGSFEYDGQEHYLKDFFFEEGFELVGEDRLEVTTFTKVTNVREGYVENVLGYRFVVGEPKNYDLTCQYGTISITPRVVVVASGSATWGYDGKEHYLEDWTVVSENGFVKNAALATAPTLRVVSHTTVKDVKRDELGAVLAEPNVLGYEFDGNDWDALNYDIRTDEVVGELVILPRSLVISTPDMEKQYDGLPLGDGSYEYTGLLDGHVLVMDDDFTQITDVGEATNIVTLLRVEDALGADVTSNYDPVFNYGTLRITQATLRIYTPLLERMYDGTPLGDGYYIQIGLASTDTLVMSDEFATITDVGEADNVVTALRVENALGDDVTDNYIIEYGYGTLRVLPRVIMLTTGSQEWEYDGIEHFWPEYEIIGGDGFVDGEEEMIDGYATRTAPGETPNIITFQVKSATRYTTQNYEFETDPGVLKIRPRDDGSNGDLGGGDPSEDPTNKRDIVSIYSESAYTVYMRYMSYGSYNGSTDWDDSLPYPGGYILENGTAYSVNNLTSAALKNSGLPLYDLKITHTAYPSALVPYYVNYTDYDSYTSDIGYASNKLTYSTAYYPYSFVNDNGASLRPHTDPALVALESAYREFVYSRYMLMPDDTRDFMEQLIEEKGFDPTSPGVIAAVADYVQSAGAYKFDYNRDLDETGDVAVAFLRDYKEGVCRHFATSAVMLYRALGFPARYTVGVVGTTKAGEWVDLDSMQSHAWVEVYIDGIGWVYVEATGSADSNDEGGGGDQDGSGGGSGGGGSQLPMLVIKPVDVVSEYTGSIVYAPQEVEDDVHTDLFITETLEHLLSIGYTYTVTVNGSRINYGTTESTITDFVLFDPEMNEVQTQFRVVCNPGMIMITKQQIQMVAPSSSKEYDGTPLVFTPLFGSEYGYYCPLRPAGVKSITVDLASFPGITVPGQVLPIDLTSYYAENGGYTIIGTDGSDLSDNYTLVFIEGGLTVHKRRITINSGSMTFHYNGEEHTYEHSFLSFGTIASGQTLSVTVIGSITDVGEKYNEISEVSILDADGKQVRNCYDIYVSFGRLVVVA